VVIHTVKNFGKMKCAHAGGGAIVCITLTNVSNTVDRMSATQIPNLAPLLRYRIILVENHRSEPIPPLQCVAKNDADLA